MGKINNRALESFDSTGYFVVKLQLSRKVHFSKKRNHNHAKWGCKEMSSGELDFCHKDAFQRYVFSESNQVSDPT